MDFFKSVFSEGAPQPSEPSDVRPRSSGADPNPSAWSFGGLIKTLATKSESVIGSYRRDFEELGSELKKETAVIREAASRAVKDLPQSLEIRATVAQESLESVGQAIDDIGASVWKSTAQIIARGRDTIVSASSENYDSDSSSNNNKKFSTSNSNNHGLDGQRYSRFDMLVRAAQCDMGTYCTEPEDFEEYHNWRLEFVLEENTKEIEELLGENGVIRDIYREAVPSQVDSDSFWSRYFYRVHKLKKAEDARARLVKRAISGEEEEDLSWDFDDNDDEEEKGDSTRSSTERENSNDESIGRNEEKLEETDSDKVVLVEKGDNGESSCKDSDLSVVSSQPSLLEEQELGWDEIEDIGSNDETNKGEAVGSTNRAYLPKQLSVAEEDEDLTWDIEEDDDPVKS